MRWVALGLLFVVGCAGGGGEIEDRDLRDCVSTTQAVAGFGESSEGIIESCMEYKQESHTREVLRLRDRVKELSAENESYADKLEAMELSAEVDEQQCKLVKSTCIDYCEKLNGPDGAGGHCGWNCGN